MSIRKKLTSGALACVIATATLSVSTSASASDAGAFIGGVLATKVVGNMRDRTEAEQQQAAAQQQQAYVATRQAQTQAAAPAPAAQPSAQQRLQELDKLAAGGYITPEQYKAKKQAIIDSM